MTEAFKLSATDAIAEIIKGQLSRHEWVLSCIDEENAIKKAKKLDDIGLKENLGLPFGIKDIIDSSNLPSTLGTPFYSQNIPIRDAGSVAIAKETGCIVLGKTVTTELGHRAPGPTKNPHNHKHTPGGSSSGSAAAVANMMVPICLGTQTTGSVIRPAAYCGVIGYKPTYGDFDKSGILPNSPSIDTLGLMTRSVEDLSLFRSVLLEEKIISPKEIELKKLKIAFVKSPHWNKTDTSTQENLIKLTNNMQKNNINIIDLDIDHIITKSIKYGMEIYFNF